MPGTSVLQKSQLRLLSSFTVSAHLF